MAIAIFFLKKKDLDMAFQGAVLEGPVFTVYLFPNSVTADDWEAHRKTRRWQAVLTMVFSPLPLFYH